MFTQYDEEPVILEYLKGRTGRFLDVGAADGVTFSNTRALYLAGWKGTVVEPNPCMAAKLLATYGDDPDMAVVVGAVIDTPDIVGQINPAPVRMMVSPDDFVSTTEDANWRLWAQSVRFQPCRVAAMTVQATLAVSGPVSMLSVDTEGTSLSLCRSLLLWHLVIHDQKIPDLVVVEFDDHRQKAEDMLKSFGYDVAHSSAINMIGVRA